MVYEFKSRATGNVLMTQGVAERLLAIINKAPGATGIITTAQMPGAIQALQAAVAREKAMAAAPGQGPLTASNGGDKNDEPAEPTIGLAQRALPLIEMMQRASQAGKDITWGV